MSALDKIKEVLGRHSDKTDAGIERAGDMVDERTGGKHTGQVDQGVDKAQDGLDSFTGGGEEPTEPGSAERPGPQ